jgi:hypothetical protein
MTSLSSRATAISIISRNCCGSDLVREPLGSDLEALGPAHLPVDLYHPVAVAGELPRQLLVRRVMTPAKHQVVLLYLLMLDWLTHMVLGVAFVANTWPRARP